MKAAEDLALDLARPLAAAIRDYVSAAISDAHADAGDSQAGCSGDSITLRDQIAATIAAVIEQARADAEAQAIAIVRSAARGNRHDT